jgi:ketosteroid isomerase-like protein
MADRSERLREAYAALDGGDVSAFRSLFARDARWLGVAPADAPGETPT